MRNRSVIDEVNEKTDIVALISSYVKLERRGKNYFGLCPFHDDTDPSMSVSPEKNIFKCFSCGVGGGPINFFQQINNTTFNEALAELAEPLGIKVGFSKRKVKPLEAEHNILKEVNLFYQYYLHNSKSSEVALNYLKDRKLSEETIKHFNIGFSPLKDTLYTLLKKKNFKDEQMLSSGIITLRNNQYRDFFNNRVIFPILDINGNTVAFSGRSIDGKEPKYYNSPETKVFKKGEVLYHLYESLGEIRKQGYVILHEGFFDCIASYEAGLKNTVATMGTALTIEQAKLLENYTKRVIIAFDGDTAGINAAIKAIDVLSQTRLRIDVLKFEQGLDPDDFVKKHGKKKYLNLYKTGLKDQYEFIYTTTKESLNLKNANDMAILKDATNNMLRKAPASIKDIYINRLSEDLGVTITSLTRSMQTSARKIPDRPRVQKPIPKKKKDEIPEKFYRAERELLISMFRSKDLADRIDHALSHKYVCDIDIFKLRTLLKISFYSQYDKFDEDIFREMIIQEENNGDLLNKLNEIYNSLAYQKEFIFGEKEVEENIKVLKSLPLQKRYDDTVKSIKEETESFQKTYYMEKQRKLKLEKLKQ